MWTRPQGLTTSRLLKLEAAVDEAQKDVDAVEAAIKAIADDNENVAMLLETRTALGVPEATIRMRIR